MRVSSSFGGEHKDPFVLVEIHEGCFTVGAALCTGRVENEQRSPLEHSSDLAFVRPELVDDFSVPI